MTSTERFKKFLNGEPVDRAPVIEWAGWWDQTIFNWWNQGLPRDIEVVNGINEYFGQDRLHQFWLPVRGADCPAPASHGAPIMENEKDYAALKKHLYGDQLLEDIHQTIRTFYQAHKDEGYAYWYSLEGFFWFPRTLFGIENHLYAFYDYPELMKEINQDLCTFYKKVLDVVYSVFTPHFMTFAEDMSYNLGPMCSKEQYDAFILPYYKELTPVIKSHGTKVLIDTDGFVEPLIPWFLDGGIQGILPLERMAGVDVNRIRENYPDLIMIGGYDKTIMHLGEEAMRKEFERILPAIRSGLYIPGVDHQTPPDVTIENYRIYMRLLKEYSREAAR